MTIAEPNLVLKYQLTSHEKQINLRGIQDAHYTHQSHICVYLLI